MVDLPGIRCERSDVQFILVIFFIFMTTGSTLEVVRLAMAAVEGVSATAKSFVGSSLNIGALVGVITGGRVADGIGRRLVVLIALSCLLVISLVALFLLMEYRWIVALHILKGFAFGMAISCAQPWATESFSEAAKGWASAVAHVGWPVGSVYGLMVAKLGFGSSVRYLEVAPVVPCVVALVLVYLSPESERWRSAHQRESFALTEMLRTQLLRLVMTAMFWIAIPGCSYILYMWGPELLMTREGSSEVDLNFFVMMAVMSPSASFVSAGIIDLGRRRVLVVTMFLISLSFLWLHHAPTTLMWKIAYACLEFLLGVAWTIGPVFSAELFPTVYRATAYGILQFVARIAAISGPVVTGVLMDEEEAFYLLYGMATVAVLAATSVLLVPEMDEKASDEVSSVSTAFVSTAAPAGPRFKGDDVRLQPV
jgi:MFS family permease